MTLRSSRETPAAERSMIDYPYSCGWPDSDPTYIREEHARTSLPTRLPPTTFLFVTPVNSETTMSRLLLPLATLLASFSTSSLRADLSVASVFSDHMVVQRDMPVTIWGTADGGESVVATFAGQSVSTRADAKGVWRLTMKPLAASAEGRTLEVKSGSDRVKFQDVLVGDVWLGSGQSNMAGRVASYARNDETLAKLATKAPFANIRLLQSGGRLEWTHADAAAVQTFSALHFSFGAHLQQELDIPVGLIVGAVGGTPSGFWIPPSTYAASDRCKQAVASFSKDYDFEAAQKAYETNLAKWERRAKQAKAAGKKVGRKPRPPVRAGESTRGGKIGQLYQRYIAPVAGYRIRGVLWDQGEARSGVLGIDQQIMMSELIRGWREQWGHEDFPFLFVQKPSGGGCAWDDDNPITRNADRFTPQLPDQPPVTTGDQRHLYVRLMNNNRNAWMVPASDLGSGIHPTNKWGYGVRAAQVALSQVYPNEVQAYGPIYKSHEIKGDQVIVSFSQVGQGLAAAHQDDLQGFALAGEDGTWHWATAKIDGERVIVHSKNVPKPQRVCYAYASKRTWANLFNQNGLPALCFMTP